ncbi:LON peptidase substrate-binding domain-containing protein [Thalassotalea castellviae]|uniref:ATP-dependent protease n=1 Tax=Thalassotalea castellviae TaxID=3075612 RepID=A0ABU3A2D3_9GAMM|nr:LON peptidase substrate-binding domain-containing protein [Thalassotalea sp. W431]MDT0604346.1 ATP-dependent protease [Thalassotalea sp. W431]
MKAVNSRLPIFPLPVFLLPNGITRLRIFEPRYLKLVKIASTEQGFIILLNAKSSSLTEIKWGSWVDIINFDEGEDGVLEIDVQCKSLVEILSIENEKEQLNFGCVKEKSHWSQKVNHIKLSELSSSLEDVFKNNIMLNTLYNEKPTHNASWVVARWLELLPINLAIKNTFINDHSYQDAENFVHAIILND